MSLWEVDLHGVAYFTYATHAAGQVKRPAQRMFVRYRAGYCDDGRSGQDAELRAGKAYVRTQHGFYFFGERCVVDFVVGDQGCDGFGVVGGKGREAEGRQRLRQR